MQEIWKDIPNYEGLYEVSNLGTIKRIYKNKKEKILKAGFTTFGYLQVSLSKNNKQKSFKVHRLVAQAFLPNPNNYREVNHIDGNKQNNRVDNLEWCTPKENIQHSIRTGLRKNTNSKKVNQYDIYNNFITTWSSLKEAQITCNINHIVDCCKGRRKTAGGFIWRYDK